MRCPALFAAAELNNSTHRLIDTSTWGDLQRSSTEDVFLEETEPKLESETFVLPSDCWINLADTQKTHKQRKLAIGQHNSTYWVHGYYLIRYTEIHVNWTALPLKSGAARPLTRRS